MNKGIVVVVSLGASVALAVIYLSVGRSLDILMTRGTIDARVLIVASGAAILSGICSYCASLFAGQGVAEIEANTRHRILDQVFSLGVAHRFSQRTGRIVNMATDGTERVANYRGTFIAPMIASLLTPVLIVVIIACHIDIVSAIVLAVSIPLIPLVVGAFRLVFKSVSQRYRKSSRTLAAQELDAIQGLSSLVLLNAADTMGQTLNRASEDVRRKVMRYLAGNQIVIFIVDSVFSLGIITSAVVIAIFRMGEGAISLGDAFSLLLLSTIMLDPLDRIGQFFYVGMGGMAARREINGFCAQSPTVHDADGIQWPTDDVTARIPQADDKQGKQGIQDCAEPFRVKEQGRVSSTPLSLDLENVDFSYSRDVPVLSGASMHISPGEHVVLTGSSGAGKTSVVQLIRVAYRPESGIIRLGGHDLVTVPIEWVRKQISFVSQNTYLFSGTLRDNLLVADEAADDDQLMQALKKARLDSLLGRLPAGLDTPVGERGLALSGGEVQRVAIARALLKDSPILILDEPSAHVDLHSEREILKALDIATRGRTTLTISHRRTTIDHAEREIRLENGSLTSHISSDRQAGGWSKGREDTQAEGRPKESGHTRRAEGECGGRAQGETKTEEGAGQPLEGHAGGMGQGGGK